jgi:uncharacterized damage-inducible protein DinB
MIPFAQDFLNCLEGLHADIRRNIEGLAPEALHWSPGPETNSMGVLIVHLVGAERYWIGDVALQELSNRDRAAEFRTTGMETADLLQRLNQATDYARAALERISLADLEAERISPRDGRTFTVAWALLHALEHTAIHCGHIQIQRQLWGQSHAPIR